MAAFSFGMSYNGGAASYSAALRAKLSAIVKSTAQDVKAQAVVEITQGEKSGRIYSQHGVKHQASAPDESPANDTGNLINSISVENTGELTSVVNVGAPYGLYLEVGTVHVSPRPFISPALAAVEPAFIAACERAIANP